MEVYSPLNAKINYMDNFRALSLGHNAGCLPWFAAPRNSNEPFCTQRRWLQEVIQHNVPRHVWPTMEFLSYDDVTTFRSHLSGHLIKIARNGSTICKLWGAIQVQNKAQMRTFPLSFKSLMKTTCPSLTHEWLKHCACLLLITLVN